MITDLKKEIERLSSFQEVFIADNQRLESKLKELTNRRHNLTQQYNSPMVKAMSKKYKKHLKDEQDLRKLIQDYQLAIDYLRNPHSSILSSRSYYQTPDSSRGGFSDLDIVEKELQEEDLNLSVCQDSYYRVKSLYSALQGIKAKVSEDIKEKKKIIGLGVEGLNELCGRLEFLRELEILACFLNGELIHAEQIRNEMEKTKDCWEHHLGSLDVCEWKKAEGDIGAEIGNEKGGDNEEEKKEDLEKLRQETIEVSEDKVHLEEYGLMAGILFVMDQGKNSSGNQNTGKVQSKYRLLRIVGTGTFSIVYEAINKVSSEIVAIKKIKIESKSSPSELDILSNLSHPNIILLKEYYYSKSSLTKEKYLNIVTEFLPFTLADVIKHYVSQGYTVPLMLIKFYSFQLLLAIRTLHSKNICHRDIKPSNVLIEPKTHQLKLIDFGSAKILTSECQSVSYVCSRHYRAPELIFGARVYKWSIDMWSFGCVLSEMFLGQPIFPGESSVDQLVEIVRVLGTPTREMLKEMNEDLTEFRFPAIRTYPFSKVFDGRIEREALEIISALLVYEPSKRLNATQALKHSFFKKVHDKSVKLPNGEKLPVYIEDAVLFDI